MYLQYAYISNPKWNKTWQIKFVNRNSVLNYNISLSSWGKCSGICNSVQNRYLKKWNVSAVGSFTLRFSFKTKRDFRALKNWNIDWINVTLPVSVFLEASSFVDFVWSSTLLDVTSKINRSKIWIHIQYSIFIFSLLAWEKDFRSLQRESSPPTYSTRLLRVQACLQSTFTYGYMLRSNIQSNQPTNRASFRLLLGRVQSKS